MANRNADLLVYLKLDDINPGDSSVTNYGDPSIIAKTPYCGLVADDLFGACLNFNGKDDFVETASTGLDAQPDHTLEAWIKADAQQQRAWILLLGQQGPNAHHWLLNPNTTDPSKGKLQIGSWSNSGQFESIDIPLKKWTHLATVFTQGKLSLYVDGNPVLEPKTTSFNLTEKNLRLGQCASNNEAYFKGQIAHVRLYRSALTAEQIRKDMQGDQLAMPAYRDAHPIAFSLYDENQNFALYIDDNPNDTYFLTLELRNTSASSIIFSKTGDKASAKNYHFELVFRPGTLSENTLKQLINARTDQGVKDILTNTEKWDIFCDGENQLNGSTSIYFLYRDTGSSFNPGQRLSVKLRNIKALAGAGARGTRAELRLNQLHYADNPAFITGSRVQHLQIINHTGSSRVPLHVCFAGSNHVLNDGASESDLVLQLMNVTQADLDTQVTLTPKTEFLISFDVKAAGREEEAPWSLCNDQEAHTIQIAVVKTKKLKQRIYRDNKPIEIETWHAVYKENGKPEVEPALWSVTRLDKGQSESFVWSLSPKSDLVLARDDYFQVYIWGIKSSMPSGLTNLYLEYRNIPGFWQGQVICAIEKSPLLFRPGKNPQGGLERRVGIDTATPKNVLDVRGAAVIGKNYAGVHRAPDGVGLLVEGRVGIGTEVPEASLSVMGSVHIGGKSDPGANNLMLEGNLLFKALEKKSHVSISRSVSQERPRNHRDNCDSSLFIGIQDSGPSGMTVFNFRAEDDSGNSQGIVFSTYSSGWNGIEGGHRMLISHMGNVGIGSQSPNAKLCIMKGGVHIGGESDPGENNLFVKGKISAERIGIGSENPGAKFCVVGGGVHIGGETDPGENNLNVKGNIEANHLGFNSADVLTQLRVGQTLFKWDKASNSLNVNYENIDLEKQMVFNRPRMIISFDSPGVTILGGLCEQMDTIPNVKDLSIANSPQDHPLKQYFKTRLSGKPPGTLIRAISDFPGFYGQYFEAWVTADHKIILLIHPRNKAEIIEL